MDIKGNENLSLRLSELDCCERCILIFIELDSSTQLDNFDTSSMHEPGNKLNAMGLSEENIVKRVKKNPCPCCLGILEESTIERFVASANFEEIDYYKSKEFITLVSIPKCLLLRYCSMCIHLQKDFPNLRTQLSKFDVGFKRIFRVASSDYIGRKINKVYKSDAKLSIEFEISYEHDEDEIKPLFGLIPRLDLTVLGRNTIYNVLKDCSEDKFRQTYPVPPPPVTKSCTCKFKFKGEPLYLGGRYLKFSREMGQTPFVVNEKVITEYDVETTIFDSMRKILRLRGRFIFSSSGREDCDTRMLGDGRPFYIQIEDPGDYDISFEQFRAIEEDILNSNQCAVIKLQCVHPKRLRIIKEGEMLKKKHYLALCKTGHPNINHVVKTLNNYKNSLLKISQQTPMRVLHRRTISARPKAIYSMEASLVPGYPDMIELKVKTEAGTYVKEFVNGDFNRTVPSVQSIINFPIDVVALDVLKVELEWP